MSTNPHEHKSIDFGEGNNINNVSAHIGDKNYFYDLGAIVKDKVEIFRKDPDSSDTLQNRLQDFVGREQELEHISRLMYDARSTGGYILITGRAGEGKSSIIAQLIKQAGVSNSIFHFIPLIPRPNHQLSLLNHLIAQLLFKYGIKEDDLFPNEDYASIRNIFSKVLQNFYERNIQETIYIDGLDQIEPDYNKKRDLSFLPSRPPPGIVFVLGTRPNDTLEHISRYVPVCEHEVQPLEVDDFRKLLEKKNINKPFFAEQLHEAVGGNALCLNVITNELIAAPTEDLEDLIARIPNNPELIFTVTLNRLESQDAIFYENVVRPLLALLLVLQEPLDINEIKDILGIPVYKLERAFQQLGGLVVRNNQNYLVLDHLMIRNYLQEKYNSLDRKHIFTYDELRKWHSNIVSWCISEQDQMSLEHIWQESQDSNEQIRRSYARRHYFTHLVLSGDYQKLWNTIDDGIYGRNKCLYDPSTTLYTQDLDLARSVALSTEETLALWRASLLRVTLTSRFERWPDAVFVARCKLGEQQETLKQIELISDPVRRIILFCKILPLLEHNELVHITSTKIYLALNNLPQHIEERKYELILQSLITTGLTDYIKDFIKREDLSIYHEYSMSYNIPLLLSNYSGFEESIKRINETSNDLWYRVEALLWIAEFEFKKGSKGNALQVYELLEEYTKEIHDLWEIAKVFSDIAISQKKLGMEQESQIAYISAIDLAQKALNRLDDPIESTEDWLLDFIQAEELNSIRNKNERKAEILAEVALWQISINMVNDALESYDKAIAIAESIDNDWNKSQTLSRIASSRNLAKLDGEADELYKKSIEILEHKFINLDEDEKYSNLYTDILTNLIVWKININEIESAISTLGHINDDKKQVGILENVLLINPNILLLDKIINKVNYIEGNEWKSSVIEKIIEIQISLGNLDEAREYIEQINDLSLKEKNKMIESIVKSQLRLGKCASALKMLRQIDDVEIQSDLIKDLVEFCVKQEKYNTAHVITDNYIDNTSQQSEIYKIIAEGQARNNNFIGALVTTEKITDQELLFATYQSIALSQFSTGQIEAMMSTLEQITDEIKRAEILINIIKGQESVVKTTKDSSDLLIKIVELINKSEYKFNNKRLMFEIFAIISQMIVANVKISKYIEKSLYDVIKYVDEEMKVDILITCANSISQNISIETDEITYKLIIYKTREIYTMAIRYIKSIDDLELRIINLIKIADGFIQLDLKDDSKKLYKEAEMYIDDINGISVKFNLLIYIANGFIQLNLIEDADKIYHLLIDMINDFQIDYETIKKLISIGNGFTQLGLLEKAKLSYTKAINDISKIENKHNQFELIIFIIQTQRLDLIYNELLLLITEIDDSHLKDQLFQNLSETQAVNGNIDISKELIEKINDDDIKIQTMYSVAKSQIISGEYDEALETIKNISDDSLSSDILSRVSEAKLNSTYYNISLDIAKKITSKNIQAQTLYKIARYTIEHENIEKSIQVLRYIECPELKAESVIKIVNSYTNSDIIICISNKDNMDIIDIIDECPSQNLDDIVLRYINVPKDTKALQFVHNIWCYTNTRNNLLERLKLILPFIKKDTALAHDLINSFEWVDKQISDSITS